MRKLSDPEALGRLREAIRAHEWIECLTLTTEQVESTEGEEKAYWLTLRAEVRGWLARPAESAAAEADMQEAWRLGKDDPSFVVTRVLKKAIVTQQPELLREIPRSMRARARGELFGDWRYWMDLGAYHKMRRRWYQWYRSETRAVKVYLALSPEERKYDSGWIYHLRCVHSLAATRIGRLDEAAEDVRLAAETRRERPDISPMLLAWAQAELALCQGDYPAAKEALNAGTALLAQIPRHIRPDPTTLAEFHMLAARIARAEGNMVGFRHFCEQALAIAIVAKFPCTERDIRLIMDGAEF